MGTYPISPSTITMARTYFCIKFDFMTIHCFIASGIVDYMLCGYVIQNVCGVCMCENLPVEGGREIVIVL